MTKLRRKSLYSSRADKDSYPHDGRADKGRNPHDRRADKNPYRQDRRADSLSLVFYRNGTTIKKKQQKKHHNHLCNQKVIDQWLSCAIRFLHL